MQQLNDSHHTEDLKLDADTDKTNKVCSLKDVKQDLPMEEGRNKLLGYKSQV